jgi:hypothetical protein
MAPDRKVAWSSNFKVPEPLVPKAIASVGADSVLIAGTGVSLKADDKTFIWLLTVDDSGSPGPVSILRGAKQWLADDISTAPDGSVYLVVRTGETIQLVRVAPHARVDIG